MYIEIAAESWLGGLVNEKKKEKVSIGQYPDYLKQNKKW